MFPNSKELRCSETVNAVGAASVLIKAAAVPVNVDRITNNSFLYCDMKDHHTTHIVECAFDSQLNFKQEIVEQFMGEYQYYCFGNDHTFLLNREGDIICYDHLTKNTIFMQKQHPSLFHPPQLHSIGQAFLTCGGNVKNSQGENEKIIKVWKPAGESELEMKCRIVTGHSKPIDNSLILARNKVVTLSSDLTVRSIHLSTQQVQSVIPVSMSYYSGSEVDWNSAILGGIGRNLSVFDFRGRKLMRTNKLPFAVTQISAFTRVNSHTYLFSDVNALYKLDLRTMVAQNMGEYEGQRISCIKVLGPNTLILGNHDKSLQVWQCY